jgi:hypothetical protein
VEYRRKLVLPAGLTSDALLRVSTLSHFLFMFQTNAEDLV